MQEILTDVVHREESDFLFLVECCDNKYPLLESWIAFVSQTALRHVLHNQLDVLLSQWGADERRKTVHQRPEIIGAVCFVVSWNP